MAEGLKPPQPFTLTSNTAKDWPQWRDHFTYYMKATKKNKEEPATQVAVLLTAMGKEAISVYKTFCWAEDDDKDKLDTVLKAFDNYFKPKRNVIYERFIFLQRKQKPGATFESFYTDLLRLVETCDYHAEEKGNIIRDQVVMNISSDTIREKLLHESGLTLERAVDMCRSMEATSSYLTSMSALAIPTKEYETVAAETEKALQYRQWSVTLSLLTR